MIFGQASLGLTFSVTLVYYISTNYMRSSGSPGRIVSTNSGKILGLVSLSRDRREFDAWLGIPYAKPPVGQLRFATPQPVEPWAGVRDGTKFGGICAQMDILVTGAVVGVEDCLYLNVFKPKIQDEDKYKLLPVVFFIHSGYFASGASNLFRPDYFMDEDVVLVTINYRLGALGFLSTGDSVVRGNMGLKDQYVALKWIKENVQYFGGDPNQITAIGESSGASSVHYHMLSNMSRGLLNKGISQSGTALSVWSYYDDPFPQAQNFAREFNCPADTSQDILDCLRQTNLYDLLYVHRVWLDPGRTKDTVFVPVVERYIDEETFLADDPLYLMKTGQQEKLPWMNTANADEGLILTHNVFKNATYRKLVENNWDVLADSLLYLSPQEKKLWNKISEYYFGANPHPDYMKQFKNLTRLVTDKFFMRGLHQTLLAQANQSPIYLVYYNRPGPTFFNFLLMMERIFPPLTEVFFKTVSSLFKTYVLGRDLPVFGVCHGDDLIMLFNMPGIFFVPPTDFNYPFSKDFVKLMVSFASNDDETKYLFRDQQIPRISTNTIEKPMCLELNIGEAELKEFPTLKRLQFWESLDKEIQMNEV